MEPDKQQPSFALVDLPTVDKSASQQHIKNDRASLDVKRRMLNGELEVFATTLVALLTDHFDSVDWFSWEPDVLGQEVEDDFGVKMPIVVRDKIWALVSSLTTDRFYNDPLFFNHVSNALSGGPTPMQTFEPATLDEQAWAVLEVRLSDSGDNGELEEFGAEVAGFVGKTLQEEEINPFPPLEFAPDISKGGFGMTGDPGMVSAAFKDREDRKNSIQDMLLQNVERLHQELDVLKIRGDSRKERQRTTR